MATEEFELCLDKDSNWLIKLHDSRPRVRRHCEGTSKVLGLCDDDERVLEVYLRQESLQSLADTVIHETLHMLFPDLSEKAVTRAGMVILFMLLATGVLPEDIEDLN